MMEKMVVPARDILSFSAGLDTFGVSHLGGGGEEKFEGTPEQKRKLQLQSGLKRINLFHRGDYGYHKYDGNPDIKELFSKDDKDTIYDLNAIAKAATTSIHDLRSRVRIFNAERHAIEASHLGEEIIGKKSMKHYVEKKNALDQKTLKELSKLGKNTN
jgi:hypothetical protein